MDASGWFLLGAICCARWTQMTCIQTACAQCNFPCLAMIPAHVTVQLYQRIGMEGPKPSLDTIHSLLFTRGMEKLVESKSVCCSGKEQILLPTFKHRFAMCCTWRANIALKWDVGSGSCLVLGETIKTAVKYLGIIVVFCVILFSVLGLFCVEHAVLHRRRIEMVSFTAVLNPTEDAHCLLHE